MLVHCVYFWLKPELTEEQRQAFRAGVETLAKIPSARAVYVGTPAATPQRPVIDTSYDVGLTVVLDSLEKHDEYQEHPIHHAFVADCKQYWDRVLIYDAA